MLSGRIQYIQDFYSISDLLILIFLKNYIFSLYQKKEYCKSKFDFIFTKKIGTTKNGANLYNHFKHFDYFLDFALFIGILTLKVV